MNKSNDRFYPHGYPMNLDHYLMEILVLPVTPQPVHLTVFGPTLFRLLSEHIANTDWLTQIDQR